MLNFLKLASLWKIESDCVQDDHYALENLISSDETRRRIGFMTFAASGPPISITLECKHKIDLKMIKVRKFNEIKKVLKLTIN